MEKISIKRLNKNIPLPFRATKASAGFDLHSAEDATIKPMEFKLISSGISIALPDGFEAQIRSRSGLAAKNGVIVLNSPGTIDSDFRGEIKICLINLGKEDFQISVGMRIAQMVINKYANNCEFVETEELDSSERGEGGFGSTGT